MGLPAYDPELPADVERLHYFHPFRIAVATLLIFGAYVGLLIWMGGNAAGAQARLALPVALLIFAVGRTFQPRTLSANATDIRWKKLFQPVEVVSRRDVVAIQYVTTAGPGTPRYYFVNRDGSAVLWVDRFTPSRMGSFASYLGIPMRPVAAPPPKSASADAAFNANAVEGARRSFMVWMAVCAFIGLAFTVGGLLWAIHSGADFAAYQRAPLCEEASADPLACRYSAPAVVTGFSARGHIDIRFLTEVPTFHFRTTYVRLANGAVPNPPFAVGDTVQIEVFNGSLMAINGAHTDGFTTLESNSSWLLVAGAGLFLVIPLIGIVVGWRGSDSWFVRQSAKAAPAKPSKPTLDDPPAVTDERGPKERAGAIERVAVTDPGGDPDDAWPTLVKTDGFDLARYEADSGATGIPEAGERLLARARVHFYGAPATSSILLLTDRRLVIVGPMRLEIPRSRISLVAYWASRDSVAVTYRTMSGPRGILVTGPQLVLTGGPKTDVHRLFEAMRMGLTNPDQVREPVVVVRPTGRWSRLTHRLWLARVG